MLVASVELRPDVVIARTLRLLKPLGSGGMGIVWAARHLRLDMDVAVKFLRPDRVASNPALLKRFEREAKAAARIAHPNVVRVMDYGAVDDAVPFIVMELLEGALLTDLLERGGRLSFATARSLIRQVGAALESAHAEGIVHRDVKPHNVFITQGSKDHPLFVKVLDFGVAKVLGDRQVPGGSAVLTETGTIVGSPPYMSPEQLEGRDDVDLRSDLWSLGIILYEALTGERPFQGGSFVAVGAAVLNGRYRPASELRRDLPSGIDDWFAKALCPDPEGRFQAAQEMVDAFVELDHSGAPMVLADALSLSTAMGEATTVEADALEPAQAATNPEDDITATHAPVAKKPPPEPAPAPSGWRSRRTQIALAAAAVTLGGGALVWTEIAPAGSGSCPPGMILVEGKTFPMGSAEEGETPTDETPLHDETVASFCLDMSEVTVRAYRACEACERPMTVELEGLTPNGRDFNSRFCNGPDAEDHPMNCIDWDDARTYCAAVGKRLPTEEEWELAARGTTGRTYPWGNAPPDGSLLNACGTECSRMLTEKREAIGKGAWPAVHGGDDGAPATASVGSYRAQTEPPWDLAGNVWEWTSSAYCPYGNKTCGDSRRVLRGGGWDTTEATNLRAARRLPAAPNARGRSIGFRCALTP